MARHPPAPSQEYVFYFQKPVFVNINHRFYFPLAEKTPFLIECKQHTTKRILFRVRRGCRVAEGAALEMLFTRKGNEGSNPSLSAIFLMRE